MLLRYRDKKRIIQLAKTSFEQDISFLAFGSRVNGRAHDMSDLNLAIKTKNKNKLDIQELQKFKDLLSHSNVPIIVQVIDWYRVPISFHDNILANREEIELN